MRTFLDRMLAAAAIASGLYWAPLQAQSRPVCTPAAPAEKPATRESRLMHNRAELVASYAQTYQASERLRGRAFWSNSLQTLVIPYDGALIRFPLRVAEGISQHLSLALTHGVADAVSYADLGHLHVLIPDAEAQRLPSDPAERMEIALASANLRVLYHTAEMVQLKEGNPLTTLVSRDSWKQSRYYTRNLLGEFGADPRFQVLLNAVDDPYNTVRSVPGMTEVGTLYFSANHDACFPFWSRSGVQYFDLTFDLIPYK